jgi:hypothetical protein
MSPLTRLEPTLERPWAALPADIATFMEPHIQGITTEIVAEVARKLPDYAESVPHLTKIIEGAVRHFTRLIADPEASWEPLIPLWREIGGTEAAAGHSLERLESANRSIMRLVWQRIVGESETHGLSNETLSLLLQSLLAYVGKMTDAAGEGHLRVESSGADELRTHRHTLLRELLRDEPIDDEQLRALARVASWPVPASAAVVLLLPPEPVTALDPPVGVLADLDRRTPLMLLPDPDTPGRIEELERALGGWKAVVGPAVPPAEAARSRRWAAEALLLVRRGIIPQDTVVRCVDHVPTLVIFHAEGLLDTAAARRLRPFGRLSAPSRHRLSQTLLTLLRCHFNATKAAAQLHVHPQTVRLRLQRLEEIFGDELQNRDHRLEMQMLLYAGLARGMRR